MATRVGCAFITSLWLLWASPVATAAEASRLFETLTQDAQTRAQLERQLDLVRPSPPGPAAQGIADTRFQPVAGGLGTAALLARSYPASARAEAERLFQQLLDVYPQVERRHGIPRHDLAGAVATFIAGAYTGYTGLEVEDEDFVAVVRQMREALGRKPGLAAVPARDKQAAYEQLVVLALLSLSTHEALAQQPRAPGAAQIRANLRTASKGYLESLLGTDADRVRVNQAGVTLGVLGIAAAGPAPVNEPTAEPAAGVGAIQAVVLVQGYAMTGVGGGLVLKYSPAVLFRDGRYTRDARRALQGDVRIDGRWTAQSSGWALTDAQGKTTQVPASMRAEPAEPGAPLQGSYRSLAGVGSPNTRVGVVSAWAEMSFQRDGSVQLGQGAGATAGTVATASSRGDVARYRLDGHVITLDFGDGRQEQRLFYFVPGQAGKRAIGIGGSTLSPRR